jgi:hypothetical protein
MPTNHRKIFAFILLMIFSAIIPFAVHGVTFENPIQSATFQDIINRIIDFLFYLALAVAPIMVLFGGYKVLTAGESENNLGEGKKIIIYTIIGLLIVLFAKGIVSMLKGVMGVK